MSDSSAHLDETGQARMVDVGDKEITLRRAVATACIEMQPETLLKLMRQDVPKGDVLAVACVAGIMAAKRTPELIPLCHPLMLDAVEVKFDFPDDRRLRVTATVSCRHRTGVEMEALCAASIAALTVYDMCKSVDRGMVLGPIRLEEKTGGKTGLFSHANGESR